MIARRREASRYLVATVEKGIFWRIGTMGILWAGAMGHDPQRRWRGIAALRDIDPRLYRCCLKRKWPGYVWWRQADCPGAIFLPVSS